MRWIPFLALLACKPQLAPPVSTDDVDDTDTDARPPTPPPPPALTAPEDAGPMSFQRRVVELDTGQELPLRLRIFEPDAPNTRIALFLTGFSLAPDLYDTYSEHLASHGYVSIGVGLRTNAFTPRTQLSLAQDVSAVIDWIATQPGALGGVDTSRVVIAGHSLGGKLALLTALEDSRVYGVLGIDPLDANPPGVEPSADNPSIAPERMGEIDFPVVFIGQDTDTRCIPPGENYRDYFDATVAPVVRIEIEAANHISFLDRQDCGFLCTLCDPAADDPMVTRQITHGVMLAYFEHQLFSREGARDYLITLPGHNNEANINVRNGF